MNTGTASLVFLKYFRIILQPFIFFLLCQTQKSTVQAVLVADPGCLSRIPDPGSALKNLSILTQKNGF
jgi:hypothetical protein